MSEKIDIQIVNEQPTLSFEDSSVVLSVKDSSSPSLAFTDSSVNLSIGDSIAPSLALNGGATSINLSVGNSSNEIQLVATGTPGPKGVDGNGDRGEGLNTEEVQDVVGAMLTGNTETGIVAEYKDEDGTIDLAVDHDAATNFVAEEHYRWDNDIQSTATISHANLSSDTGSESEALVINDGDAVWGHPEKIHLQVRNDEGATIPAGAPLYSRGEIGGSNRIKVGICDADDSAKMPCIGLAEVEMNTTSTKDNFAITQGIYNTNISGFTGLAVGNTLYVDTSGSAPYLTKTKPREESSLIQNVGIVVKTNGTICQGLQVSAIGRTNDVPNLNSGYIFYGNGSNQAASTELSTLLPPDLRVSGAGTVHANNYTNTTPDATNVAAAGALMDSELTDLAGVKGVTISTLQVKPSEGAFVDGDKTKLDAIEASADVTDAANVTAAGALMDSELTDLAGVKGVTISTLQVKPSEGAFANGDKTKLDGIAAGATADQTNVTGSSGSCTGNAATADALTSGNKVVNGDLTITGQLSATKRKFIRTDTTTHFDVQGDILYFGSGSTTQGALCYLKEDGSWGEADADGAAVGDDADRDAMGMLAIALGTDPDVDGMFIKGVITMNSDMGDVGNPIYIKTTAGGMSYVAPSASGDFVRVVGYCLDDNHGIMYFNPDNTWVEIA